MCIYLFYFLFQGGIKLRQVSDASDTKACHTDEMKPLPENEGAGGFRSDVIRLLKPPAGDRLLTGQKVA